MSTKDEIDKIQVSIHFKENSIPSIHAGKLTDESKAKIQALITEARIDELRRADQNAHKIKDYFKQRLRMIEIDESAIKLEGEK